jgi:hypothetical protein
VLALLYPNQVNNLPETLITPEDHSDFIKFGEFYLGCILRESASECQNLRESATNLAENPSYRSQRPRINLASNSKSTLRGIEMTLATVAYRISTDVSFAAMLQKNAEEALQQAGIVLVLEEKTALEKLLALPGQIARAGNVLLTAEPWAL